MDPPRALTPKGQIRVFFLESSFTAPPFPVGAVMAQPESSGPGVRSRQRGGLTSVLPWGCSGCHCHLPSRTFLPEGVGGAATDVDSVSPCSWPARLASSQP